MGENPDKSRRNTEMKDLRELLGDDLWSQVEPKLKGQGINGKDLNLVATNTGEFVPAEKYDSLKAEASKYKTDYEALNSKYEVDIQNAAKQSNDLLKKTIVSQALSNAEVAKVNGTYDIYFDSKVIDIDQFKLNGATIEGLSSVISKFTTDNPQLVVSKTQGQAQTPTQPNIEVNNATNQSNQKKEVIPASQGVNPATAQNAIKDAAYYKQAIASAGSFEEKMALMVEAEQSKIDIN